MYNIICITALCMYVYCFVLFQLYSSCNVLHIYLFPDILIGGDHFLHQVPGDIVK